MSAENAMDQTVPLLALISDIGAVSAFFKHGYQLHGSAWRRLIGNFKSWRTVLLIGVN